jgi:L-lactate dehydrogenase
MNYLSREIALVGCQGIDPVDVFSLAKSHWIEGLLLVGEGSELLAEITNRMLDKWALSNQARVRPATIEKAAPAAIAILNPFVGPCVAETKFESIRRIAERLRSDVNALRKGGFVGTLLVIAEPVEVLTAYALKASGLDSNRVLGMGSSTLNFPTAKHTAVWCTGKRGDAAFIDHCDPNCAHFESVVSNAAKITPNELNYSGNRSVGMALCVSRICQAILNDEHEIFPVTSWLNGQYGVSGVPATVPCVLGRNGVERIVELPITSTERLRLQSHAADVRESIENLNPSQKRASAASL